MENGEVPKYINNLNGELKYEKIADKLRLFSYPFIGSFYTKTELFELKQITLENIEMSKNYIEYLDLLRDRN